MSLKLSAAVKTVFLCMTIILIHFIGLLLLLLPQIAIAEVSNTDSEKPIIYMDTLQASQSKGTVGEKIIVSIRITDNTAIGHAVISFSNQDSGAMYSYLPLSYNSSEDRWECVFDINENTPAGTIVVTNIQAYDKIGNAASISPRVQLFSIYGGADSEKPIIYMDTLQASQSKGTVGEKIIVSIRITDNTAIGHAVISFSNQDSGAMYLYLPLSYNSSEDRWECAFDINENTPTGTIMVTNIQAYDKIGNAASISPHVQLFSIVSTPTPTSTPTPEPTPIPTMNPTNTPTPEAEPEYIITNTDYNSSAVVGKLIHVNGTGFVEKLWVRVTFFIVGNYYMATVGEVNENGDFEVEGVGPIEYITVLAYGNNEENGRNIFGAVELYIN